LQTVVLQGIESLFCNSLLSRNGQEHTLQSHLIDAAAQQQQYRSETPDRIAENMSNRAADEALSALTKKAKVASAPMPTPWPSTRSQGTIRRGLPTWPRGAGIPGTAGLPNTALETSRGLPPNTATAGHGSKAALSGAFVDDTLFMRPKQCCRHKQIESGQTLLINAI